MFGREGDFTTNHQECSTSTTNHDHDAETSKVAAAMTMPSARTSTSNSTTTSWSRLSSKDPRIVRVSRAFGGKDRHSKVCTVKGLRDRRVRLSVPTAIQLYDLQDRLGLNQPSKVVDWLLDAAKREIDELPPLQIPQGFSFTQNLLPNPDFLEFGGSQRVGWNVDPSSPSYKSSGFKGKSEYVPAATSDHGDGNGSRNRKDEGGLGFDVENHCTYMNSGFLRQNPSNSSSPSFLHGAQYLSYNSQFSGWDPSSLTLSQPAGRRAPSEDQPLENLHTLSHGSVPSSELSGPSRSSDQILAYRQGADAQAYVRPFHFSMTANLLPSDNNGNGGRQ